MSNISLNRLILPVLLKHICLVLSVVAKAYPFDYYISYGSFQNGYAQKHQSYLYLYHVKVVEEHQNHNYIIR